MEKQIDVNLIKKEFGIELTESQYEELSFIDLQMLTNPQSQVFLILKILKILNLI